MFFPKRFNVFILVAIAPFLLILGCGDGDNGGSTNFAPTILAFESDPEIVEPGAQATITLRAADIDGDPLTYTWSATDGTIEGNDSGATWVAPEQERKYRVEVRVSDGDKTTTSSIDIQVWRTRPGDYYPLAVGNTWRYRDDEGNVIIFEIVDTIQINLRDGSLIESFVLRKYSEDEELENIENFSYLGKDTDEEGQTKGIIQHAQNITSGTGDTMLFTPFLPLYNFPLIPGNKWQVNFQAELVPELFPLGRGIDEFEVLSEESVTVPAGTFESVFQVEESFKWTFLEVDLDTTVVQKWLAPDVGIIKFTQAQTRGEVTVEVLFELESFELVED